MFGTAWRWVNVDFFGFGWTITLNNSHWLSAYSTCFSTSLCGKLELSMSLSTTSQFLVGCFVQNSWTLDRNKISYHSFSANATCIYVERTPRQTSDQAEGQRSLVTSAIRLYFPALFLTCHANHTQYHIVITVLSFLVQEVMWQGAAWILLPFTHGSFLWMMYCVCCVPEDAYNFT